MAPSGGGYADVAAPAGLQYSSSVADTALRDDNDFDGGGTGIGGNLSLGGLGGGMD
jgi:hypothetical protein